MKILQIIARLQTKITYQSMHTNNIFEHQKRPQNNQLNAHYFGVTILLANITAKYFLESMTFNDS